MKKAFLLSVLLVIIIFPDFVFAESGIVGVGFFGGKPLISGSRVIESESVIYTDTEFANASNLAGGHIAYIFPSESVGAGINFSIRRYHVDINVSGENYGTLKMLPIILGVGIQGLKPKGWTGHGEFGIGFSLNRFNKTPYLLDLEKNKNDLDFKIKTSFVYQFGGGIDYFITKNLAFSTDLYLIYNTPYIKNVYGNSDTYVNATSIDIFSGLTYLFGR